MFRKEAASNAICFIIVRRRENYAFITEMITKKSEKVRKVRKLEEKKQTFRLILRMMV